MNIEELMNDKEFAMQINKAASAEEVVALFAAKGVEMPLEIAKQAFTQPEGELNEEDLESVSGGLVVGYLCWRLMGYDRKTSAQMAWDVWKNGADGQGKKKK